MRMKSLATWFVVATIVATAPALTAQSTAPRTAATSKAGLSAERVARIDRALQRYVDENRIAGIVALVLRDGQPVYERAVGWSDKEAERRMTTDTIFRIASQTKAHYQRRPSCRSSRKASSALTDPVSRFIPPSRRRRSPPAGCSDRTRETPDHHPRLADSHGRDLLRHRAGDRVAV